MARPSDERAKSARISGCARRSAPSARAARLGCAPGNSLPPWVVPLPTSSLGLSFAAKHNGGQYAFFRDELFVRRRKRSLRWWRLQRRERCAAAKVAASAECGWAHPDGRQRRAAGARSAVACCSAALGGLASLEPGRATTAIPPFAPCPTSLAPQPVHRGSPSRSSATSSTSATATAAQTALVRSSAKRSRSGRLTPEAVDTDRGRWREQIIPHGTGRRKSSPFS